MTDILLSEDYRLRIENGDFVIGDATDQNQRLLILSDKADFKATPMRCVGARRFLEDHKPDMFAREIRQEFSLDGMTINRIKIDLPSDLEVDANY